MSWTDERVETLRKLWADGHSASQIAAEIGNGITRNAVIGKVHRLGLSGRVKPPSSVAPRQRAAQPRAHRPGPAQRSHSHGGGSGGGGGAVRGNTALAYAPRVYEAPAPKPLEEVLIPMSERVTIMELREAMCRWPLGDPAASDFRYCGGKSETGVTYCPYHARLAYQPAQDRRRDREKRQMMQIRAG